MASNNDDKITVMTPKGANPEVDGVLLKLIEQLDNAKTYFEDKQPFTSLFELMLVCFRAMRLKHGSTDGIAALVTDLALGFEETITRIENDAAKTNADIELLSNRAFAAESALEQRITENNKLRDLVNELRGAKTTLELASSSVDQANQLLLTKNSELQEQVQALQSRNRSRNDLDAELFMVKSALEQRVKENLDVVTKLKSSERRVQELLGLYSTTIKPVTEIGVKELEYLGRIETTIGNMKSQIAEGMKKLAEIGRTVPQPATPHQANYGAVLAELKRRQSHLDRLNEMLEELGRRQRVKVGKIDETKHLIKYLDENPAKLRQLESEENSLLLQIDQVVELKGQLEPSIRDLESYLAAIETVGTGIPTQLIGQQLPQLPDIDRVVVVETAEKEKTTKVVRPFTAPTENQRFNQLMKIGSRTQLPPLTVFIISLHECLGSARKATLSLLKAASQSGLTQRFGLPDDNMVVYDNWRSAERTEEKFLHFHGNGAGGIYVRSQTALGWKTDEVFSTEEVSMFQKRVAELKAEYDRRTAQQSSKKKATNK